MNILLVTEPGVDGVFRYVEGLAHFLVAGGHEVHLAYSDKRGSDHLGELVEFVAQNGGRTVNLATGNRPAPSDLRALRVLRKLAREVRPDIIHSHSSKAGGLARLLPLLGISAPQLYHPHAYAGMRPHFGMMRYFYNQIEALLGRWSYTINCSRDEQNFAKRTLRIPSHHAIHVPNGVDTDLFSPVPLEKKREIRQRLGLPPDAIILGSMGRTSEQKDPWTLYRAFALAAKNNPDVILYHVGQGEKDAELNEFVKNENLESRVIRRPYLSTPVDFHRAVDGFILTSLYEGFSLAVLEALACNLPLILSRAPGNTELQPEPLSHAQWVTIGDSEEFSQAISNWSRELRERGSALACNHREVATATFSSQRNLGRVLDLYRQFAPSSESGPPVFSHSDEPDNHSTNAPAFEFAQPDSLRTHGRS